MRVPGSKVKYTHDSNSHFNLYFVLSASFFHFMYVSLSLNALPPISLFHRNFSFNS